MNSYGDTFERTLYYLRVRTYKQYCGLAYALDAVGDRWTLLIVRELLIRGSCRYADLQFGLPGIATNMLASRLKDLEKASVVQRIIAKPPVATDLYELTPRGRELESVLNALGHWGAPLMASASQKDVFRGHWMGYALEHSLVDNQPDHPPIAIEISANNESLFLETNCGTVRVTNQSTICPIAKLKGKMRAIFDLLRGQSDISSAQRAGVQVEGDIEALRRVQPNAKTV